MKINSAAVLAALIGANFTLCDTAEARGFRGYRGQPGIVRDRDAHANHFYAFTRPFTGKVYAQGSAPDHPDEEYLHSPHAIRAIQRGLAVTGDYRGEFNGSLTSATRRAIQRFQGREDLPVTGEVDTSLVAALGISATLRPLSR